MIVAGFGFSTRATLTSLRSALAAAQAGGTAPQAVATLADKALTLAPLARELGVALIEITHPRTATPTQSPRSLRTRGTGSVAEACALDAVGAGGYLLAPRAFSDDRLATCALAQGGNP